MTKGYLIMLMIFLLTFSLWAGGSQEKKNGKMSDADTMEKDTMMSDTMEKEVMEADLMEKDTMIDDSMEKMMPLADEKGFFSTQELQPRVIPFTTEADAQALAKNHSVVYFFGATWCPNCKTFYNDVKKNYTKLPADVKLIFVNYDTQKKLKDKYGVATQHSFIQINADGSKESLWVGSLSVDDVLNRINKG